jgi:photosystem II stability/assembly factor-like uncharacterized protein
MYKIKPIIFLFMALSLFSPAQRVRVRAADDSVPSLSFYLYRSDNHGTPWSQVGAGLPKASRINALLIEGSTSYAGTDEGVFVSSDAGQTWSASVITPPSPVQCFTVSGRRVYAGTKMSGVFFTKDEGRSWQQVVNGLPDWNVRSLAARNSVVYAGTDTRGVFLLSGEGKRWVSAGQGLPDRSQIFDLAVKKRHLYAALYSKGLYRMEVGGSLWKRIGTVTPLEFLVRGDSLIAGHNPGGIYHSIDDGVTWKLADGLSGKAPIWVLGDAGPNVLAGTSPGAVSLSDDLGANWKPNSAGIPPNAAVIAIGGSKSYTLAAIVISSR